MGASDWRGSRHGRWDGAKSAEHSARWLTQHCGALRAKCRDHARCRLCSWHVRGPGTITNAQVGTDHTTTVRSQYGQSVNDVHSAPHAGGHAPRFSCRRHPHAPGNWICNNTPCFVFCSTEETRQQTGGDSNVTTPGGGDAEMGYPDAGWWAATRCNQTTTAANQAPVRSHGKICI